MAAQADRKNDDIPSPVVDRFGSPAGVENLFLGGHVFLILGGPSAQQWGPEPFRQRGICTFGVNNVAAAWRPNIWTYGDTTNKFHDSIWTDPKILKLAPYPKLTNRLRTKLPDGSFQEIPICPRDCPNVLGIYRNSVFDPPNFLYEKTVNWGNGKEGWQKNSRVRVLSTMFQALRLCYYLGFRHVYLVGCDFLMDAEHKYGFAQERTEQAYRNNNNSYAAMQILFQELRPHFDAAGFEVLNLNPESRLAAFDHLPIDAAFARAWKHMPRIIDTEGWYEKAA